MIFRARGLGDDDDDEDIVIGKIASKAIDIRSEGVHGLVEEEDSFIEGVSQDGIAVVGQHVCPTTTLIAKRRCLVTRSAVVLTAVGFERLGSVPGLRPINANSNKSCTRIIRL